MNTLRILACLQSCRSALWVSVAVVLSVCSTAQSQVLLEENFTFTGALTNNGWTTAANPNSNALTATSPGLTYPHLPSSGLGNGVNLTNGGEDDYKLLTATNFSGDIYTSFLVNVSLARTGDYFYAFYSTATAGGGYFGRVHVRSNSTGFNFGIGKTTAVTGTSPTYETNVRSLNTTYLVVAKMSRNAAGTNDDVVSLWVNPALGTSETAADITNAVGADNTNFINAVALRQGSSTAAPNLRSGNILVGTTWASVTPTAAAGGPVITSFNPTTGPAGTSVTIAGSNFTGATNVAFNSVAASSFTVNSASQITATVPSGATTGPIGVATPQGFGASADNFVVPSATVTLPAQINEGATGTGTVNLTSAAPVGGVVVSLVSSSPADLVVPDSVTVAEGFTSADFQIDAPLDGTVDTDVVVTVTPTATNYVGVAGSITVKNIDISTVPLTSSGYSESFSAFTSAATLPLGWTLIATTQTYSAWETTAAGAKYNSATVNVFGYKHSGSTGVVQQVLTLRNETGSTITDLTVSYFGRAFTNAGDARDPSYTVTVDGQTVSALSYSTADGDNVQRSASLSGLNIAVNQVFQIIWSSDGSTAGSPGSNTRKQIGVGNVSVSATAALLPPTVGSLSIPLASIAQTSAGVSANVSADGGSAITSRGFVYAPTSINADPAIGGTGVVNLVDPLAQLGAMSATLTGLTASTQYSVKAYATNAQGTSYTAAQTFTTLAPPASFAGNFSYAFDNFAGVGGLPGEWTAVSSGNVQTYAGLWTSTSSSAGFYGGVSGPGVIGYTHTSTTGALTVTLRLVNNTGSTLNELYVSYLGRVEALVGTRFPEWTVTVAGVAVPSLTYSTASGVDETKTALVTGLNVPNGQEFSVTWVSTRGENATGNSRRIGLANVVIGTSAPATPIITATPASLSGLTATQGTPGVSTNFLASASNLTNNITVTANDAVNFAISTNNSDFTNTLTLLTNATGGLSNTPVYVRLTGAAQGAQVSTVSLASGSVSTNVAVSGTVTGTGPASIGLNPTSATNLVAFVNQPGTAQQVTVTGTGLSGPIQFTAAPSDQYEVAAQGGSFGVAATLPASGGVALVRIKAGATAGSVGSAQLTFESGSATNTVAINGTRISGGTGGLEPSLLNFANDLNFTATARFVWVLKSDTVSGRGTEFSGVNVGGNLGVAAGASFDVVLNGAGSSTDFSTDFWKSARSWLVFSVTGNTAGAFSLGAITPDSGGKYYAAYGSFGLRTDSGGDVYLDWTPSGLAVASISVNPGSLSLPGTTTNVVGASTNFTASGANLTNNITVTASDPVNFAISTNNTVFTNTLTLATNSTGVVSNTTVHVRLRGAAAGSFTNTVALVSGTTSNSVTVSGAVAGAGTPIITVSTNSLPAFTSTTNVASAAQSFFAQGTNLSANITVTAPTGFSVAFTSNNADFGTSVTLTNSGGVATNREVFVRMNASAVTNSLGPTNIILSSTGASNRTVSVSGTIGTNPATSPSVNVTPLELTNLRTTQGTQSAPPSTFTLTASNLQGPVTVSAVSPLLVSTDGGTTYAASAVVSNTPAGTASNTVRVVIGASNALVGTYTNTNGITFSTPGATSSISGLSVVNGNFSNLTGLTQASPQWWNGVPTGWTGVTTNFTVRELDPVPSGNFAANLNTLTTLSPFVPLYQAVGTLSTASVISLNFELTPLVAPTSMSAGIFNTQNSSNYNNWTALALPAAAFDASGFHTLSTSVAIAAGTPIGIAFWQGSGSPGAPAVDNVTISASGGTSTLPSIRTVHTVLPGPSLSAVPTALSNFSTVVGVSSTNQSFNLSASNLLGPVSLSVSNGYEISFATNSGFAPSLVVALTSASDTASNYTTATWTNGANGGSGFGPWALPGGNGGTGFNGAFIGPATNTLSNYAPLYTAGVAFSIYAGGSGSAYQDADRTLSRPLAVGETLTHSFGIAFDNGNKGFDLYEGTNQVFNFNVNISGYSWTGGNTAGPTPYPTNREFGVVIDFAFTRTTNGFTYAISSLQDTNLTRSGSLTNGGIDRIKYYISGAGGGDPGNIYFNNFRVAYAGGNVSNLPVYVRLATNAPVAEVTNSLLSKVAISSPLVAPTTVTGPAIMTYVGAETGAAVTNWSSTNVPKTYDLGGSERYGTAGYYQIRPTATNTSTNVFEAAGAGNNLGITAATNPTLFSVPSFVASTTGQAGTFVNFAGYSSYAGPNGTPLYRQGALSVPVSGRYNSPAGPNSSSFGDVLQFTLGSAANFRLGLAVDSVGDATYAPDYVTVYNGTASVFSDSLTRNANPEMVFYDISGNSGDTITVALWKNNNTNSPAALSLVTFDAIPNPGGTTNIFVNLSGTVADRPVISHTSAFAPFAAVQGFPSDAQQFTVGGNNLNPDGVLVTAPAAYEVSTNQTTWSPTVTVPRVGAVTPPQDVFVRIASSAPTGTASGDVTLSSSGAESVLIPVVGEILANTGPALTATPASLAAFATDLGTTSAAQSFTLTGRALSNAVILTAPSGFRISTNGTAFASNSTIVPPASGFISNTVSVHLVGTAAGIFLGNVNAVSGAASATNSVSGTVFAVGGQIAASPLILSNFTTKQGTPSPVQTFLASAQNLGASNLLATASAGYEVSTNSTNFTGLPVSIAPVAGRVDPLEFYVRIGSNAPVTNSLVGSVTLSGGDSTNNVTVVLSGDVDPPRALSVTLVTPATNPTTIAPGSTLRLSATVSDTNTTGAPAQIARFEFRTNNTPIPGAVVSNVVSPYTLDFDWTPAAAALPAAVTAWAVDVDGWEGSSAAVTVRNPDPGQPVVGFTPPVAFPTNSQIETVAPATNGAFYVGGSFTNFIRTVGAVSVTNAATRVARILADGTVDTDFVTETGPNSTVRSLLYSATNHGLYIAGAFTNVSGVARPGLARLAVGQTNVADGTLDESFAPALGAVTTPIVNVVVQQYDNKILVGGIFSTAGVETNLASSPNLARFHPDGTRDISFLPPSPNGEVKSIALQPDGKILIAGSFAQVAGRERKGLARLNIDGTLDETFAVGTGPNGGFSGTVWSVAVALDGSIYAGGQFSSYNGKSVYNNLAKLSSTGVLQPKFNFAGTFAGGVNNIVRNVQMRPGGDILVSGLFTQIANSVLFPTPVVVGRVAEFLPAGTLDATFNTGGAGANNSVLNASTLANGNLVLVGAFTQFNGQSYPRMVVLAGINATNAVVTSPPFLTVDAGSDFNFSFTSSGTVPYGNLSAGLPRGVYFNAAAGMLSGIPLDAGAFDMDVSATTPGGGFGSPSLFRLQVLPKPVPYDTWKKVWFSPSEQTNAAISGRSVIGQNPSGQPNFTVYALSGGSPKEEGTGILPEAWPEYFEGQQYLAYTVWYYPLAEALYTVQTTGDLQQSWSNNTVTMTNGANFFQVRPPVPMSLTDRQFLRLQISAPAP